MLSAKRHSGLPGSDGVSIRARRASALREDLLPSDPEEITLTQTRDPSCTQWPWERGVRLFPLF